MHLKGTVSSATGITSLTNYKVGDCYKATATFTVSGVGTAENGDMFVALNARSTYSASDWTILQNNVDTMSGATSSAAGARGLVPAPSAGDQSKFLSGAGTWQEVTASPTVQYTATLSASDWISSSGTYTYALVLTSLTCGSNGTVSPIISYTSNQTEYNYITSATATPGTGITFTATQQPENDIGILIIDLQ